MIQERPQSDIQIPVLIRALRYGLVCGTNPGQQLWLWL